MIKSGQMLSGVSSSRVRSCPAFVKVWSNPVWRVFKSGQILSGVNTRLVKSCLAKYKSGQILSGVSTSLVK